MTPEASAYLEKARQCPGYARINLTAGLGNDAGRNAYLAMFHAAQALIFERKGKPAKTHHGLHAEFNHLANSETGIAASNLQSESSRRLRNRLGCHHPGRARIVCG